MSSRVSRSLTSNSYGFCAVVSVQKLPAGIMFGELVYNDKQTVPTKNRKFQTRTGQANLEMTRCKVPILYNSVISYTCFDQGLRASSR